MVSFNSVLPTQAAGVGVQRQNTPQADAGAAAAQRAVGNLSTSPVRLNNAAKIAAGNLAEVFNCLKDPVAQAALNNHLMTNPFLQPDKIEQFKKAQHSVTIASHNLANNIGDYHANMWQFTRAYNQLANLQKGFEFSGFPKLTPIAEYPFYKPHGAR